MPHGPHMRLLVGRLALHAAALIQGARALVAAPVHAPEAAPGLPPMRGVRATARTQNLSGEAQRHEAGGSCPHQLQDAALMLHLVDEALRQ